MQSREGGGRSGPRSLDWSSFTKTSFSMLAVVGGGEGGTFQPRGGNPEFLLPFRVPSEERRRRSDEFRPKLPRKPAAPSAASIFNGCCFVSSLVPVLHQQTAAVDRSRWNQLTRCDCWVIKAWTPQQPCHTFLKCKVDNYQRAAECLSLHLRVT